MRCLCARRSRATYVVLWLVSACVSDPAVEADVPASPGAVQPGGNGGSQVAAAEACTRIKAARTAAADKLGCDDPGDECPRYLYVAGAMPCDEYAGDSLDACEVVIGKYESCADLSARPCVVTPVAATCHKPAPPAASDAGDSS